MPDTSRPLSLTPVFSGKLDDLPATIRMCTTESIAPLRRALDAGRTLRAVAVGSGGSLAAAHFLATSRRDFSVRQTTVMTPMEFVLGFDDLADTQVWLLTGRGENADIAAALRAADQRGAADIQVLTGNPDTPLAAQASTFRSAGIDAVPVADTKDGFLSTHTLAAFLTHILLATDELSEAVGRTPEAVVSALVDRVSASRRDAAWREWQDLAAEDTVLLLVDPLLSAAGVGIETSLWETAIAAVQRTDFRNFAHGRHIWPARRGEHTVFLALTTRWSRSTWGELNEILPAALRRHTIDYGMGGRLGAAFALLDSLVLLEAMGAVVGVDPGRPGRADYGKPIYEAQALDQVSRELSAPVRHKVAAVLGADGSEQDVSANYESFRDRIHRLAFRGLVLDYDGTVVATADRYQPPEGAIVDQLRRLLDDGMKVGVATGRGGSAGERLREALTEEQQASVIVGYYNGGYIQPLAVDLERHPAPVHPAISELSGSVEDFAERLDLHPRTRGCQISIDLPDEHVAQMMSYLLRLPGYVGQRFRILRSQHSVDIVPFETNKLKVVEALAGTFGFGESEVLCIGDSGHSIGNDHDLLGHPSGLSVDRVCARPEVCWAPFGSNLRGPDALRRILSSLFTTGEDGFKVDLNAISASPNGPLR